MHILLWNWDRKYSFLFTHSLRDHRYTNILNHFVREKWVSIKTIIGNILAFFNGIKLQCWLRKVQIRDSIVSYTPKNMWTHMSNCVNLSWSVGCWPSADNILPIYHYFKEMYRIFYSPFLLLKWKLSLRRWKSHSTLTFDKQCTECLLLFLYLIIRCGSIFLITICRLETTSFWETPYWVVRYRLWRNNEESIFFYLPCWWW